MSISKKKRDEVKAKFNGKCAYSGTDLKDDWQVDHIEPKLLYGIKSYFAKEDPDDINNLVPCQRIINHYKRALPLELFRTWFLGELHLRLKKLPRNPKKESSIKHKKYLLEVAELFGITTEKPFSGVFYFETIDSASNLQSDN